MPGAEMTVGEKMWRHGQLAMKKGNIGMALQLLQQATVLEPGLAGAWLSFGVALGAIGQADQSCVAFAMARTCALRMGPSGDTVAATSATNLESLVTKHRLSENALPQRIQDTGYRTFLRSAAEAEVRHHLEPQEEASRGAPPPRRVELALHSPAGPEVLDLRSMLHLEGLSPSSPSSLAPPFEAATITSHHASEYMKLVERQVTEMHAMRTRREAAVQAEAGGAPNPTPTPPAQPQVTLSAVVGFPESGGDDESSSSSSSSSSSPPTAAGENGKGDEADAEAGGSTTAAAADPAVEGGGDTPKQPPHAHSDCQEGLKEEGESPNLGTAMPAEGDGCLRLACIGAAAFPLMLRRPVESGGGDGGGSIVCCPSTVEIYASFVQSPGVHGLNFVDAGSLEEATGLSSMQHASSGLKGACRAVDATSWGIDAMSTPQKIFEFSPMSPWGTDETFSATLYSDIAFPPEGCTGILLWEAYRHDLPSSRLGAAEAEAGEKRENGEASAPLRFSFPNAPAAAAGMEGKEGSFAWQYMLYFQGELKRRGISPGDSVAFRLTRDFQTGQLSVRWEGEGEGQEGGAEAESDVDPRLPLYHASMLNHSERTVAYRDGLTQLHARFASRGEDASPPIVLDLGCGTGLLSLLAEKAGFTHVVAVERFAEIAHIASRLFRDNAVGDRVKLLVKHSNDLTVEAEGGDLPRPADILVHEIFGSDPLSEGLLKAYNTLLSRGVIGPQTVSCPHRFRVVAAVVESAALRKQVGCGGGTPPTPSAGVEAVDVPPAATPRKLECDLDKLGDVTYLTQPVVVWDVALKGETLPLQGALPLELRVSGGEGEGEAPVPSRFVASWFEFACGDDAWCSTQPRGAPAVAGEGATQQGQQQQAATHWQHSVEVLPRPVEVSEGGVYKLKLVWNADRIIFAER